MIPITFGGTVLVLTGNAVGQSNKKLALVYFREVLKIGILVWSLQAIFFVVAQTSIISIFTNDALVLQELKETWYIWLLFNLFFMIQTVQSGVIRGTGKIAVGALLTCIGYLMIGAPLSKELDYDFNLGLNGIWIGACVSSLFLVAGY